MNDTLTGTGWHFDADTGLTTRNPTVMVDGPTPLYEVLALPDDLLRRAIAVHEAGHVAVMLYFELPFERVAISDDLGKDQSRPGGAGEVTISRDFSAPLYDALVMLAAGERAQDRWLHEADLWTGTRGWAAEAGALGDRGEISRIVHEEFGEEVTYGTGDDPCRDLAALHDRTDALLDLLWSGVAALADALTQHGQLNWEQAAAAARFSLERGWQR
ncbi:hypothetical protein ACFVXH_12975 [Kitasatospora sp. NPDC058184]|uniref:hypothetical protein n=1 Tax=Kitasatospora sp. NPDC058184 TaxID=3346370 RepID=UPI0036DD8253